MRLAVVTATATATALGLLAATPGTAWAQGAPPTLTGEALTAMTITDVPSDSVVTITAVDCDPVGGRSFSFEASGPASGPYAGTFTETGTVSFGDTVGGDHYEVVGLSIAFDIVSGDTRVEGTKELLVGGTAEIGACIGGGDPTETSLLHVVTAEGPVTYEATIVTAEGTYRDRGVAALNVVGSAFQDPATGDLQVGNSLDETDFASSLTAPEPVVVLPTTPAQCRKGGWRAFPEFKNQGDCVSFVRDEARDARREARDARRDARREARNEARNR